MNTLNFTKGPRRVPKYKKIQLFAILNDLYKNCIKKPQDKYSFTTNKQGLSSATLELGWVWV